MDVKGFISFITDNMQLILAVVGFFALIATKTKNTWDNKLMQYISDAINFLGANVGRAKNAPDVVSTPKGEAQCSEPSKTL